MSLRSFVHRHRGAVGLAAGLVVGSLLAGGVAMARIPDSRTGVITACRATTGAVRLIDAQARQKCRRGETLVRWNATGPRGPQGLQGPQGPTGPSAQVIRKSVVLNLSAPAAPVGNVDVAAPAGNYVASVRANWAFASASGGTLPILACTALELDGSPFYENESQVGALPPFDYALQSGGGTVRALSCELFLGSGSTSATGKVRVEALLTPTPGFAAG